MSVVLGVSVGASAVRMAQPTGLDATTPAARPGFERQALAVRYVGAEDLAAQSVGVMLERDNHSATAVTYGSTEQAAAVHEAMARQRLYNYRLVPETSAALALLEHTGVLGGFRTVVLYDLGSSGVTVSVVDRDTGTVLAVDRSTAIGGDHFDRLILDQQVRAGKVAPPADARAVAELTGRCRAAKEQLSTSDAACLPGDGGLLLLSRETFESLIVVAVEGSARLARQVIAESGRRPDSVVLLGGGAHIPLVRHVLGAWLGLPTLVPAEPEMVAAQGAALMATPVAAPAPSPDSGRPSSTDDTGWLPTEPVGRPTSHRERGVPRRQLVIAGTAAGALALIAVAGLALGTSGGAAEQPAGAGASDALPSTTVTTPSPTPSPSPSPTPDPTTPAPPPEPVAPKTETPAPPPPGPPPPPPGPPPLVIPMPGGLPPIEIHPPPPLQLPRF